MLVHQILFQENHKIVFSMMFFAIGPYIAFFYEFGDYCKGTFI
jgi:hypothetical protein